jgi:hypothetical protein
VGDVENTERISGRSAETKTGSSDRASSDSHLKANSFVEELLAGAGPIPDLCVLTGYLGRSSRPDVWRLYLTPTMNEYLEIAQKDIRFQKDLLDSAQEFGGAALWVQNDAELTHVFIENLTVRADDFVDDIESFVLELPSPASAESQVGPAGELKTDSLVDALVSEPASTPDLAVLRGYLGKSPRTNYWRLYLTPTMDEYLEIAEEHILLQKPVADGLLGIGGSALWVYRDVSLKYVSFHARSLRARRYLAADHDGHARPGQDHGYDPRPSWREHIRRRYPVRPGEHRRHIISYRYFRNLSRWFDAEHLRTLGYDPDRYGGVDEARRAWVLDRFNDPNNFWRGSGRVNSWLGRWMWFIEPFNWDFPTQKQAREEQERRDAEARERERLARLERERLERERLERERLERERRQQQQERERQEREREERRERH